MIQSAIALSAEIDDVFSAATDLAASIRRDLAFQKNSIGILYYDYEVESDLLARYLEDMLAIPIIGCSSIALLEGKTGYHEMSVMLSVLTSSDCFFSASVTNPLTQENACQELIAGCDAVRRSLVGEPKMLFFLPPLKPEIVMDRCLESLTEAAGGVPVLGGVPSGKGELLNSILFSGNVQSESAVLLMVSGPIHPVYAFANVLSPISDRRGIVTRAVDTTIYEVDGMPLVDFFESYGLRVRDLPSSAVESFFNKYTQILKGTEST